MFMYYYLNIICIYKKSKSNNNMEGTVPINLINMEGTRPLRGQPYPVF